MLTYFKSLRRKIGGVTLMLACASMGEWVRSQSVSDILYFPVRKHFTDSRVTIIEDRLLVERGIISVERTQTFLAGEWFENHIRYDRRTWRWKTSSDKCYFCEERFRKWRILGMSYYEIPIRDKIQYLISHVIIPLWSIVIPLTAVSAWLLLSKRRAKTALPITHASENV